MAATLTEALNQLEYIEKLIKDPTSFSKEEIKDKPGDGSVIKALKRGIQSDREIKGFLAKWKAQDLTELSANIQAIINEKDNTISERDKTIQSLELKNEKLTNYQKKLIQHLDDARLLISHLQKDLEAEKQDKDHIQKELTNALAILNKPKPTTSEMGTQTDLTAEQIKQMGANIEKYQSDIQQEQNKVQQKEVELSNLQKELKELTDKQKKDEKTIQELKAQIPNMAETMLLTYCVLSVDELLKRENELRNTSVINWDLLRDNFIILKEKLLDLITKIKNNQITQQELQDELTKLQTTKTEQDDKVAKLEKEIEDLQKQVEDEKPNKTEKELLDYVERGIETPYAGTIPPNELLEKLQKEDKWTSLRPEYEIVRQKLIKLTKRELERRDLQTKITKLTKNKEELQTKYDMEVRSKEELVKFLSIYRKSPLIPVVHGSSVFMDEKFVEKYFQQHNTDYWRRILVIVSPSPVNYSGKKETYKDRIITIRPKLQFFGGVDFISPNSHYLYKDALSDYGRLEIKVDNIQKYWLPSSGSYNTKPDFSELSVDFKSLPYFPGNNPKSNFFLSLNYNFGYNEQFDKEFKSAISIEKDKIVIG